MSIFWYRKEKENHSNKIIATSQPNSRIKEYEKEIEDIPIRNDVLFEIATFLAKRWSNTGDVSIIISKEKKITTNIEKRKLHCQN